MGVIGRRRESVQELIEEREWARELSVGVENWHGNYWNDRIGTRIIGRMGELVWELSEGESWDGSYRKEERIGTRVIRRKRIGVENGRRSYWKYERIGVGVIGRR